MDWMNSTYSNVEFYSYIAWLWAVAHWRLVSCIGLAFPLSYGITRLIDEAWEAYLDRKPIILSYEDKSKLQYADKLLKRAIRRDLGPMGVKEVHLDIVRHHDNASVSCEAEPGVFTIEMAHELLRRVTEKQVAAVVLHEVGHIVQYLMHVQDNGKGTPYTSTHRDEYEADFYAASYMGANTIINALKRVQKLAKLKVGGIMESVGTHPPISARIHELRKWKREKLQADMQGFDADDALLDELVG